LNSVDSVIATKDLKGLVDSGLAEMLSTRRWAVYRLAIKQAVDKQTSIQFKGLELNPRQALAMKWITENGFITSKQYETLSTPPISDKTAQKDLSDLENKGMIKRTGKARNTRYELSENSSG